MLCENADPAVRTDLQAFMDRIVPDGDALFQHTAEGPDDMPAHVKSVLTDTGLMVPISDGRLALGTWQGIYSVGASSRRPPPAGDGDGAGAGLMGAADFEHRP